MCVLFKSLVFACYTQCADTVYLQNSQELSQEEARLYDPCEDEEEEDEREDGRQEQDLRGRVIQRSRSTGGTPGV